MDANGGNLHNINGIQNEFMYLEHVKNQVYKMHGTFFLENSFNSFGHSFKSCHTTNVYTSLNSLLI